MHNYGLEFQVQAHQQEIEREMAAIRLAQIVGGSQVNRRVKLPFTLPSLQVALARITRKGETHDRTGHTILAVD